MEETVHKYLPEPDKTVQCHMKGIRKGICSVKEKKTAEVITTMDNEEINLHMSKHQDIYILIDTIKERMYMDQTGMFAVQSWKGNKYLIIRCDIKINVIISEPLKKRTTGKIINSFPGSRAYMPHLPIHPV